MTDVQTRDGVDITVEVSPDTPVAWQRVGPALSALDRLASALNAIYPDWQIDISLSGIPITTITAEPTIEEQDAA